MSDAIDFVRKWANKEILTNTAPADRRQLKTVVEMYDQAQSRIADLEAQLKEAREVIEFYASKDYWFPFRDFDGEFGAIDDSDWQTYNAPGRDKPTYIGGKRARAYLEKYKGE